MTKAQHMLFDYTWARTYVGLVALLIALGCTLLHNINLDGPDWEIPTSISHTYHTGARDYFVAQLFVVAAFLISYRGHTCREWWAAKAAGGAAMLIAWFPTSCKNVCKKNSESATFLLESTDGCDLSNLMHQIAAVSFFVLLAYFCFRFYKRADMKFNAMPTRKTYNRRKKVYAVSGVLMVLTMIFGFILYKSNQDSFPNILFWVEAICLVLFGIVWLVAGKKVPFFKDN